MRKLWQRLNYLTRHQVYLRVLPVVFVSVMVLGVFSWVLFEHKTLTAASSHQQQELKQLVAGLRFQMTRLAMSAELRKSEIGEEHYCNHADGGPCNNKIGAGIIGMKQVSATCQLSLAPGEAPCLVLAPRFDTEANRNNLEYWVRTQVMPYMQNIPDVGANQAHRPTVLDSDPWHEILIFDPLFLEHKESDQEHITKTSSTTQLPLLIRHHPGDENHPDNIDQKLTLMMVDLGRLMLDIPAPEWLCFVDDNGKVLWEQGGASATYFAGLSGYELLSMSNDLSNGRYQRGLVHRWTDPWMVATVPSSVLPITLFSARPANDLRTLIMRYLLFVIGMTTLALFGAIWGVMRVMNRVTRRMSELAESMSALAKGEYSRRMVEGRWDEIGQLIGYFNLMAVSLDEAHREVKDKTVHLRAALENMRLLDRSKDDFLVLISHEVRTPLTAIMGGVDFLKSNMNNSSKEEQELLKRLNVTEVVGIIQNSGERLSGFMTDAIQMTTIQSADRQLNLKLNPVVDLVEMGLCGIREKASARNIMVDNQLENQVWSVLGDAKILNMALDKILNNALMHNRDSGKIIIREVWEVPGQGVPGDLLRSSDLRLLLDQPDYAKFEDEEIRWRLIEFFNSGEPIPKERQKALFGKFELVGRIEHHHKGSGLSLPIAQGAIKCHGGQILLHSHPEDGNSFYILLPTILDEAAIREAMASNLWDNASKSVRSASGHKKVSQVTNLTRFKVKIDDLSTSVDSSLNQAGSRINSPGGTDHQKKVTIGSRRK